MINSKTKVSEIIKQNNKSIDALASINAHFTKLKNPFLRKILASRVTLEDAAKIGNVEIKIIFDKLKEIGFEIEYKKNDTTMEEKNKGMTPSISYLDLKNIVELDVRESISRGGDPFNLIMEKLKILPTEKILKIINTFEPSPLIHILQKKGYTYYTRKEESGLVLTYFKNTTEKQNYLSSEIIQTEKCGSFENVLEAYKGRTEQIDVRTMEMPAPMVSILKKLETLKEDNALLVHHKKIPQFLFPELQENNFSWETKIIDDENVKLIIFRK